MIKKIFLSVLLIFAFSYGEVVQLKNITLENLPDEYREVFKEFLLKNFSFVTEKKKVYTNLKVSWTGTSYVVCFDFYEMGRTKEISCFTALSGEELYSKFFLNLKSYAKAKERKSEIVLKIKTTGKPKGEKVRVLSEKGDNILGYKKYTIKEGSADLEGILNIDTISLNGENSKKLLQILLTGNTIKQILIIQ